MDMEKPLTHGTGERLRARARGMENLEALLGDPGDPGNSLGFVQALLRDQQGTFPEEARRALLGHRLHLACWPRELGGELSDFELALDTVRLVARRDLNLMSATLMSISAATAVLVHGSPEQRQQMAEWLEGGTEIGFALSEEACGSDVLGLQTTLARNETGYRLSGRKWLVGNALRAGAFFIIARTGVAGPGAFSSVLVRREEIPENALVFDGPVPTTGMRGIGFVNLQFLDLPVSRNSLVGKEGRGLETALKAQQVVRLMSVAGNLGCADAGLRAALGFACDRTAQGVRLVEMPALRARLAPAFAELLVLDLVARATARAIHFFPKDFSPYSNLIKWLATELSEGLLERCARTVGARSILLSDRWGGVLEKAKRDNQVIRFIDTGTFGVLKAIAAHLQSLAFFEPEAPDRDALDALFDLERAPPKFEPTALDLFAKGRDLIFAAALRLLSDIAGQQPPEGRTAELIREVARRARELLESVRRGRENSAGQDGTATLLAQAETYCLLQAATVCVLTWWHDRRREVSLLGELPGSWLDACLAVLLARIDGSGTAPSDPALADLFVSGLRQHQQNVLFSPLPVRLGPIASGTVAA